MAAPLLTVSGIETGGTKVEVLRGERGNVKNSVWPFYLTSSPLFAQGRITQSLCISKACALCVVLGVKYEGDAE